jgi:mannosyl-oligosaccharide glucosidase
MQGYGWTFYDPRVGGSQAVHDTQLQLDINTDFLKTEDGGSWAVRITGTPKLGATGVKTTAILHAAVEMADANEPKSLWCENHAKNKDGVDAACRGEIAGLGRFQFQVLGDATNNVVHETVVRSVQVPEDKIWQAKCRLTCTETGINRSLC